MPTRSSYVLVARFFLAAALPAVLTACATYQPPPAVVAKSSEGPRIIAFSNPGPHQIIVETPPPAGSDQSAAKKSGKPSRVRLHITVEKNPKNPLHYRVIHDPAKDEPIP